MHPRNPHQSRYNLKSLIKSTPELATFIIQNPLLQETIDFTNPAAVQILNKAILKQFYGINYWEIPQNFLCPPVPGRADYIHYLADLMGNPKSCKGLDIGTGANCIYPLIGHASYNWTFTASELNPKALRNAQEIISKNHLLDFIELRLQKDPHQIFKGIIAENEKFDFTMCNPPFHSSAEEVRKGSERKWRNLGKKNSHLNFGGLSHELWCEGGEKAFIIQMINESVFFKESCKWFTSLVSKEDTLPSLKSALKKAGPKKTKVIEMKQGQKKSRFIAWSFDI